MSSEKNEVLEDEIDLELIFNTLWAYRLFMVLSIILSLPFSLLYLRA